MKEVRKIKVDLVKDGEVKLKEVLKDLFNGQLDCVNVNNINPSLFIDYLRDYSEVSDNVDFNGWKCDYWYECKCEDKIYNVFGSAWYGYVKIEEIEESE